MSQVDNSTHTSNIITSIEHYANAKEIGLEKVDFEIKNYKTIIKLKNGNLSFNQTNTKPQILEAKADIQSDTWLEPDFEIFQEYEITFKPKVFNQKLALETHLITNKYMTSVVALLKKESRIANQPNLQEALVQELNKKKASSKIMIGLFDKQMYQDIEKVVTEIKEHGSLTRDFRITLCHCPDFLPSTNDFIKYTFIEKTQKDGVKTLKSSITAVNNNEELVVYTKAKEGKSARGINGLYHDAGTPTHLNTPTFETTEAINIFDSSDKITYFANLNGFITFENNLLDIKKELTIDRIDFKTGSIDLGMNLEAKIEILTTPKDEDSIAAGMSARAYDIIISGGVGDKSNIIAYNVEIGGQTHANSTIQTTNAKIHSHKGKLIAQQADIHILENGLVSAKTINVDSILGGTVEADIATVKIAGANSKFFIKESLDIDSPSGIGIKIYITPAATEEEKNRQKELAIELEKITHNLGDKQEKLKADMQIIEANKETVLKLKAKLNSGSTMANVISDQLRRFANVAKEAKILTTEIDEAKQIIAKDKELLEREEKTLLSTSITASKPWKNGALIKLILTNQKNIQLELGENSQVKRIWIVKENGDYAIKTST